MPRCLISAGCPAAKKAAPLEAATSWPRFKPRWISCKRAVCCWRCFIPATKRGSRKLKRWRLGRKRCAAAIRGAALCFCQPARSAALFVGLGKDSRVKNVCYDTGRLKRNTRKAKPCNICWSTQPHHFCGHHHHFIQSALLAALCPPEKPLAGLFKGAAAF